MLAFPALLLTGYGSLFTIILASVNSADGVSAQATTSWGRERVEWRTMRRTHLKQQQSSLMQQRARIDHEERAIALQLSGMMPESAPSSRTFDSLVHDWARSDQTILDYLLPVGRASKEIGRNWAPRAGSCVFSSNCWCYFVVGSQDKGVNPRGSDRCENRTGYRADGSRDTSLGYHEGSVLQNCTAGEQWKPCRAKCTTGRGSACLYTMMRPAKLLSVIAIARAAGVTHIVEEGRAGGLSAYIYWRLGFNVTSIEYMPIDEVGKALETWAPAITRLDGDGHLLVPRVIRDIGPKLAAKTLVIFDGEKRKSAFRNTWSLIRSRVAVVVPRQAFLEGGKKRGTGASPESKNGERGAPQNLKTGNGGLRLKSKHGEWEACKPRHSQAPLMSSFIVYDRLTPLQTMG
jgi:hypothetical protein